MRSSGSRLAGAAIFILSAGAAEAANMCQAGKLSCPTKMPAGGYCECTSQGKAVGGKAISQADASKPRNASTGGCGAKPNAPGCP